MADQLPCSSCGHYAVACDDAYRCATDEIESLKAILTEQEEVLLAVGPITCRNGKPHDRIDGCVYCEVESLKAQLADLLKGPLSNEEMPTDREWTNVEWARNQWWLHMRAAQGFEAQLAECRDKALNGFL